MSGREPCSVIEIDVDYCPLVFGVGACTAALAGSVVRKCFNTFYTCRKTSVYASGTITYRFFQPRTNYPKGATVFPYLISVSGRSATVNIAGSDDRMNALGVRGEITATFSDHPYHDRFSDKYAAGRVDGTAQTDEGGYNPQDRGTFWTKFKARNPNYAGRPMRHIEGYLDGGVFTAVSTRHFVMSEMTGPDNGSTVQIKGKDVLFLADNDKAVCPTPSAGLLLTAITVDPDQTFTLNPVGIGADYAASGWGVIGSELVQFTRSGDVITLVARGVSGTTVAAHDINDNFQQTFSIRNAKVADTIEALLTTYAGIDAAFIDIAAWTSECDRWAPNLTLTADILSPTGVSDLIGELAVLGMSIWWDEVNQEIGLKVNRPPDLDTVKTINDRNNILNIIQQDRDADRLTDVIFNTVVIDASASVTDPLNFRKGFQLSDVDAKSAFAFGDTKIKEINCRWLNHGDDATVRILSRRLLNRFNKQPIRYEITLDIDDDVGLTDVLSVQSRVISDETGLARSQLMQVISREDLRNGHDFRIVTQSFAFDKRYGYITENTRPDYPSSSDVEKARGAYFTDGTLLFGDGTGSYRFI